MVTNISEFDPSDHGVLEKTTSECFGLRITLAIETSSLAASQISWLCMTVRGLTFAMWKPGPWHWVCCHLDLRLHQPPRLGSNGVGIVGLRLGDIAVHRARLTSVLHALRLFGLKHITLIFVQQIGCHGLVKKSKLAEDLYERRRRRWNFL